MRQFVFIAIIFLCFCAGCSSLQDDSVISGLKTSEPFKGDAGDTCFDVQMNEWLEKFQQYQQTGADMFTADLKAREASLKAYRDCQYRLNGAPANDQARKD